MINFIIGFIIGAMMMMCAIGMVAIQKDKEPQNKVRFFISKSKGVLYLNIRNKEYNYLLCTDINFREWGLNSADFANMDDEEIREVFLTLED